MSLSFTSTSISSYRDRTIEFNALVERLKRNQGSVFSVQSLATTGSVDGVASLQGQQASGSTHTEFNRKASRIGLGIYEASQKVARLAKLAKRSSMFDDPAVEIQDLTALVKQDITALNAALLDLQALRDAQSERSKHSEEHSTTVVDSLKGRLMQTTKEFKEVLTTRTENLKVHEHRRQLFSASAAKDRVNPFAKQNSLGLDITSATSSASPPPWANTSTSSSQLFNSRETSTGLSRGTQLRRRIIGDVPSTQLVQGQLQQQEMVPVHDHLESRSAALQNVESTITELSGIFTQLATMVSQQGELSVRIDENMDDALANVEGAQGALLQLLHRVSSNRWLILKIFGVLIIFLLIFIIFVV